MTDAEDDEATRVDPPKSPKHDEDDEATKATGTPKKVIAVQRVLAESRKMASKPERTLGPKLHPLIPIGVAIAILAVVLALISWAMKA